MAARDFGPPVQDGPNKPNNRVKASFINDLRAASIEDDARIDEKADAADLSAALAGKASNAAFIAHEADTTNPHDVTAAQTGAYTTGQTDAAIATATGAVAGDLTAHEADTANPHGVTKAQVQLGNVPNVDATQRSNHTGTQAISTVDGLQPALDSKLAKPAQDGVYGQVLTITHEGQRWVDPPGVVYPGLLLSPDGSFDKAGPVAPSLIGTVPVADGAWRVGAENGYLGVLASAGRLQPDRYTVLVRVTWLENIGTETNLYSYLFSLNGVNGVMFGRQRTAPGIRIGFHGGGAAVLNTADPVPVGTRSVMGQRFDGATVSLLGAGGAVTSVAKATPATFASQANMTIGAMPSPALVHSVLFFPDPLPDTEIARLAAIPGPWTMRNTAVNMALANQPPAGSPFLQMYPPNKKIATGGATLRNAPGPSTQSITTLAAGTDVHDTKQTVSVSSVSYSLVVTAVGTNWVPTASLV